MDWKACLADADNAISLLGPKDGAEWQDKVASLDWTNSSVKALTKKAIALYRIPLNFPITLSFRFGKVSGCANRVAPG